MNKKFLAVAVVSLLTASCAGGSSFGDFTGGKTSELKSCMMSEGQVALLNGTLTNGTVTSVAKTISATCAKRIAGIEETPATVSLATAVLNGLLAK
ncbi:MAG: hypothetical protein J6Y53_02365 [Alphaproteobacteria bacterium]|nr:hypothetical protein [Alphaproteobacteria bacterium]